MSTFSLANVLRLLEKANEQEVNVSFSQDELSLHVQKGKQIDKSLLDELKLNKPFLIHYFKNFANNGSTTDSSPIKKIDKKLVKKIPLSFAQERLWFIHQLEGSEPYHLPTVLRLKGKLNSEVLEHTLQEIVNRHEVLRTVILEEDGKGFQHIKDAGQWRLNIVDGAIYKNSPNTLQSFIGQLIVAPFNLSNDDMLRATLINIDAGEHVLVVTMHHIASDGWSNSILVREVLQLYNAYLQGREADLPVLEIQYADYAYWQRGYLQGTVLQQKLDYWKNKLDGVETLQLPADYSRPVVQSTKGDDILFSIDKQLSNQLRQLSQQQGATLFMLLLAVYKVMLYRYSGQLDICVGTSFARRERQELEGLIGFFVNTLALRDRVNADASFTELLQQVKETTLEAYEHQDIPFEKVVETVAKERGIGKNPLFQVMLVLASTPEVSELRLGELKLSIEKFEQNTAKFDITFFITETPDGLQGLVQYSTDLYKADTIKKMAAHFENLLRSVIKQPLQKIGLLAMLSTAEEQQLLVKFNDSHVDYPTDKSVVDLFEEQAAKIPGNASTVFETKTLTYQQLNERSNQLAHYLIGSGVKQDALVPLYLERSAAMIIGMMGIMKAGAAYVPIDMDLPAERISYILADTNSKVIVSSKESLAKLSSFAEEISFVAIDGEQLNHLPTTNPQIKVSADQLAYLIYTSGTTGNPKGVMVTHRNLVDYYYGLKKHTQINQCNSFALVSTIATDLGNTVIYASLLSGGALHLFSKQSVSDAGYLHQYFSNHAIDCLKIVPTHWKALCMGETLLLPKKLLVFGGEALQTALVDSIRLSGSRCRVVNHYGPTETTIGKLLHLVNADRQYDKTIPIGKPFSNTRVYVLSTQMQLCPSGIPGQLYIAGDGVAKGYFNNAALTNEKFIEDPFYKINPSKMYGTGDQVKWLADGNIEFIGRVDGQVKIRGYRVELGEIESVLRQSDLISQAAVLATEDKQGNKRLIAYIVPQDEFDKEGIIDYLKDKLPEYMVPAQLVQLEHLPLAPNGKIDRKALPDPDEMPLPGGQYVAPRVEAEMVLAGIWQDLLDVEQVGIHDNFFELGGDSIITIQLVSRARQAGYELQVGDVFTYQTIASLVAAIDQRLDDATDTTGEQSSLSGPAGLLPIQQWYFQKQPSDVSHFNQSVLLAIDKNITPALLAQAIELLMVHHDSLRFKYFQKDGHWQQVYGDFKTTLIQENLPTATNENLAGLISGRAGVYQQSLDIEKGELIKWVWMQTPAFETQNRLLIVIHHLAIDGVSWRVLLGDLELLLNGLKTGGNTGLGYKSSSYRQWFNALEEYGLSGRLLSQIPYWQHTVNSYAALPVDNDYAGEIKIKDTSQHTVSLGILETRQLVQETPRVYHTGINDILLCALAVTLCNWGRRHQVTIGMEGHGREEIAEGIDTTRTLGWFTTHYPVLLQLNTGAGADDLIKSIKEQLRQVPDKGLGYGVLKYINNEPSLKDKQPWDTRFNYLGQLDNIVSESKWFKPTGEPTGGEISDEYVMSEKLLVNAFIRNGELALNWVYCSKCYEEQTVIDLAANYISNLQILIAHCMEQQKTGAVFTPSDYGLSQQITYKELDDFLAAPFNGKPRKAALESIYRLSGLQQGMLFHGLYEGGAGIYMRQLAADLVGVDIEIFRAGWMQLLQQHSILRSGFYEDVFSVPVQCVYSNIGLPLQVLDFSAMGDEEQSAAILKFEMDESSKPFNFQFPPLLRVALIRLNSDRFRMVWTWHHILFDGWSMAILMEGFLSNYGLLLSGSKLKTVEEDRFEDYIRYIERIGNYKAESYWRKYMEGLEHSTHLPFIATTTERNKGVGIYKSLPLAFNIEATTKIQGFVQEHHITVNTLMQGVWAYLLHRYTGSRHLCYGVIVSGRPDDMTGVEQRVGMYINTLPLHSQMMEDKPMAEWLQDLQDEQVQSRQYQYTPLQDIKGCTDIKGDLFDSILVFENYPVGTIISSGQFSLPVEKVSVREHSNYPLTITISGAGQITIAFTYNSGLLEEIYVKKICNHFEHVVLQVLNNGQAILKDIQLLTVAEEQQLLAGFNNTISDYPFDKSIINVFEQQVEKTPDAVAVVFEKDEITYRQLNERSNQLARHLIATGVKANTLVPLCVERSVEMMVAILGILKAGAAYVPIDPQYPAERIQYMLEDTGYEVVVTSSHYQHLFKNKINVNQLLCLDKPEDLLFTYPTGNLSNSIQAGNLAYVIYTSGSTGKPKGVMVTHGNVVSLVKGVDYVSLTKGDILLSTGSTSFDATTFEYWGMLLNGGQLVLCTEKKLLDIELLKAEIESRKVNKMWFTAGWLNQLVDTDITILSGLKTIIAGGEKLSGPHIEKILKAYPQIDILNGYGPTENTTFSLVYKFTGTTLKIPIPIGRPISNRTAFILDQHQKLLPVGVAGEIYLGGAGLSNGYLNNTALTEEKFIANPFNKKKDEKIYRTGDLGRWLPDGNIEFLGRIDQQVKIRGYRIELGEIETVLNQNEKIAQAVVLVKEDKEGHKRLVGYTVISGQIDRDEIVAYLKDRLPEYMVPALWVQMDSLPLTRNGKIDKDALPDPGMLDVSGEQYVAPGNEIEAALAVIWQDMLGLGKVGVKDNFFELGGDSIISMQLVSRVKKAGYQLQVADIYKHQTIAALSALIGQRMGASFTTSGEQSQLAGVCGLLPIQQWYFEKEQPAISHFNQSVLLCINKSVTASTLQDAVAQLTVHHDALRFKYDQQDGQWQQQYGSYTGAFISEDLRSATPHSISLQISGTAGVYQRSLNISKGEIIKCVWMQTPETETHNRLLIIIHHLAVDGVSWRILLEGLERLISGASTDNKINLGYKTSSYRQWYQALENYGDSASLLSQLPYWQQCIKKYNALRVDKAYTGAVQIKDRQRIVIKLDQTHTRRLLQDVPKVYHTEINDILLAALAQTLCSWCGSNATMIGLEGHGRENIDAAIDTSQTVGWFTTLYPVLLEVETNMEPADLIKTVKEQLRLIPGKGLGYGVLKYIKKETSLQGPEPWDIVFNYLGQLDNAIKDSQWFTQAEESAGTGVGDEYTIDEKLTINGFVQDGALEINWSYSHRHFDEATIPALAADYINNLQKIIDHCAQQQSLGVRSFTPSDFELGPEISYRELDQFLATTHVNGKRRGEMVESIYPLSGLQQGMLFHGLYDDAAGAYIVQFACDLIGADLEIFRKSWDCVLGKHSILRTAFYPDELNIPVQCVYSEAVLPVEILDYRGMGKAEKEAAINEYQEQDRVKGFDFKIAPLMRIGLIQTADSRYRMLWSSHHILFDGWSLPILMEGFLTAYQLLPAGKQPPIVQVDRYEDYIRYLAHRDKEAEKIYWQKYLHGVQTSTLLPFVETTADRNKGLGEYKSLPLKFDTSATAKINQFAQAGRITVNTIIQGVWAFLLHGYTGSDHIAFGVTVSGRPDDLANVEHRVGMFINTVPLRSVLQQGQPVGAWLKELQDEQVSSRLYQYTPLHEIQGWTGIQGGLFDSIIVFENYPVSKVIGARQWDLEVENVETTEQTNYPLSMIVSSADEINIRFSYNSRLLKEEYVREISVHFEHVLLQVVSNADASVGDITLLTAAEENQLLACFNDTKADYPAGKNIIGLFEKQAALAPQNTALIFDGGQLSYQQLNERSNQLAHFLRSKGVKEETLIPICMERSPSLMVAILGILKAGAAYVPIDPAYPQARIAYMLEDTAAAIVVSSKAAKAKITPSLPISIICMDEDWLVINQQPVANLSLPVAVHQLAYIIYTSGSTGKPKGVMLEHGNLYSFICWCQHEFSASRFDIVYATTSVCFDLSVFEIFYPLSIGKPVRIIENGLHIAKYLPHDTHVLTNTVPVVIQHLLQEETDMRNISVMNMAGEPIPLYVQQKLDTDNTEVRNLYGPTEDTTYSTVFRLMKNKPILIGKPIANTQVKIVNNKGALVPIGVPGEIYLSGAGVARGYLNRLELTNEKFIKDVVNKEVGARQYKTGDIGRWLRDGNIEYLGRIDGQVKVRGFRIELGEIETALLQSGMVNKAVVLAKADARGNKMLVGYVVAENVFDKDALTTWLYGKLPEHMVPTIWVSLQSLPLTPNGKIDRNALPDPADGDGSINKYIAPSNEIETALAGIWEKLLGKETVGMDDNFFELGGDSILTIQVVSRARRIGYELQPKDIFIHQTIGRLSKAIEDRAAALILGEQGMVTGFSGLIPIQQWWLQQHQPDRSHFNQTIILAIDKNISAVELNNIFGILTEHHDALRFKYSQQQDGRWLQEYGSYKGELVTENLQSITPDLLSSAITEIASIHQRCLNIETGEIIRMVLMKLPATEMNNRLLIVVHHLAIDGVSWRVLLEDMELLLNGVKEGVKTSLGHKSSSYRQWYHALENYSGGKILLSQLAYWQQAVNSYQPLPVDKDFKGLVPIKETAIIIVELDPQQTTLLLQDVPRVYHTAINDILLAALATTIAAWGQTDSVMIGLEGHGREGIDKGIDTNRTVGWFTSLYPLQLKVPINKGTDELIKSVKEQLRQVPDKGLGYGVLKYIKQQPALQGADPWDIVFNYLGQLDNVMKESKWFSPVNEHTGAGRSREQSISEKISVNALVQNGKLLINWSYSRLHYEELTISKLAEEYLTNLQQLIAHCMMRQKSGLVYTPSDYGLGADVSYEELDQFLEEDDNDNILSF